MSRRRRSFPKRQLWATWRAFVRAERRDILVVWGIIIALIVVANLLEPHWLGGFFTGAFLVGVSSVTCFVFVATTGAFGQVLGVMGEGATQDEIARAVKDGLAWGAVHNVEVSGGDVDHLVFVPAGCIAVETKFYGTRFSAGLVDDHALEAHKSAVRARGLMRTAKRCDVPICAAVLVVWGRLAPKGLSTRDDVTVVHGDQFCDWLRGFQTGPLGEDIAETLRLDLEHFASGTHSHSA